MRLFWFEGHNLGAVARMLDVKPAEVRALYAESLSELRRYFSARRVAFRHLVE